MSIECYNRKYGDPRQFEALSTLRPGRIRRQSRLI